MDFENMWFSPGTLAVATVVLYGIWHFLAHCRAKKGLSLPPGPMSTSLISGNLNQLPRVEPWLVYRSWASTYGPIFSFRAFNVRTIVLNSAKVATDLLEARSATYSDRATTLMGGTLANRQDAVFLMSTANPRFATFRRLLQTGLNARACKEYRPIQAQETRILLQSLVDTPEHFEKHIRRNAVAVVLKLSYGYTIESNEDPLVGLVEESFRLAFALITPGKYWVEFFPFLRFLPDWFPGAGFKRFARESGKEMTRIEQVPFDWGRKKIQSGDYIESFISTHLRPHGGKPIGSTLLDDVRWCAAALYMGGGDTSVSAMTSFVLLMALHPDIQARAQADIDRVAPNRLPDMEDYQALPFLKAIIKEVLRWAPVAPLGISHRVSQDDVYENLFIPKGTKIVANIWAITHDDEIYPDPFTFDPNRHLGANPQPDPSKYVFGFGRRVCPGAHFAEMSIFLNIANILAIFDISKAVDSQGRVIEPEIAWTTGVTRHLKPFQISIKPRSPEHLALLDNF